MNRVILTLTLLGAVGCASTPSTSHVSAGGDATRQDVEAKLSRLDSSPIEACVQQLAAFRADLDAATGPRGFMKAIAHLYTYEGAAGATREVTAALRHLDESLADSAWLSRVISDIPSCPSYRAHESVKAAILAIATDRERITPAERAKAIRAIWLLTRKELDNAFTFGQLGLALRWVNLLDDKKLVRVDHAKLEKLRAEFADERNEFRDPIGKGKIADGPEILREMRAVEKLRIKAAELLPEKP